MVKRLDYNEIKRYIENEGYKLLSDEYINNSTPLEMICPEGHECQIAFGNRIKYKITFNDYPLDVEIHQ